jgi:hypothetical protein
MLSSYFGFDSPPGTAVFGDYNFSFYGFIGPLTDDVPDNGYRRADAVVTGTSWVIALALPKLLNYRIVRFGKRKRLRMLDLNFSPVPYDLRL